MYSIAKHYLTCTQILSEHDHALVYTFIVLKRVNLILQKENTFYDELAYTFEDLGRS